MADTAKHGLAVLGELADTIAARRGAPAEVSYTAKLLARGVEQCAKKLGEEAVETAIAAVKGDRAHLTREAADLIYHLVVLLEAAQLPLADVMAELQGRIGTGGLAEKAQRKSL